MSGYNFLSGSDGTGNAVLAHVTIARLVGSTTLKVDSVSKWKTGGFIATIGTVGADGFFTPGTVTEITGHITAGDIIIDGFEPGSTDLGNTVGQAVVVKQTTGWANSMVANAQVAHNDDGTIKNINAPQGFLLNGKIVRTVTTNNITVAIKTLAGTDPSATNPVMVRIGDTLRTITAALSVTKNAGTNWCNAGASGLATNEIDYFVYLGYNASDGVTLGFSRLPWAMTYADFSATTTNEKYAAISTITNATASDQYELIGRFNATLSATAAFNWSIPSTDITISRPIYETRWLTLAINTTNSPYWSAITTGIAEYLIRGRQIFYRYLVNGTSNSTDTRLLLPMNAGSVQGSGQNTEANTGLAVNAGATYSSAARVYIDTATDASKIFIAPSGGTGGWTASGNKAVRGTLEYSV